MTHGHEITDEMYAAERGSLALLEIAEGLTLGMRTLVPTCTTAVVVGVGSDWQLLAQAGPIDVSALWRQDVADLVRDTDVARVARDYVVAPFAAVCLHALLILVSDTEIPARAIEIAQPLLDTGGILLDRALEVQARDRVVRRVVLLCEERHGRRWDSTEQLERVLATLWPDATATVHERLAFDGIPWSARRIVRTACSGGRPVVSRTPAHGGLLPPDLKHQVAIPLPSGRGAVLIETRAGGEEIDHRTLAAAIAMTRAGGTYDHAEVSSNV
jgi:hypothetical protein